MKEQKSMPRPISEMTLNDFFSAVRNAGGISQRFDAFLKEDFIPLKSLAENTEKLAQQTATLLGRLTDRMAMAEESLKEHVSRQALEDRLKNVLERSQAEALLQKLFKGWTLPFLQQQRRSLSDSMAEGSTVLSRRFEFQTDVTSEHTELLAEISGLGRPVLLLVNLEAVIEQDLGNSRDPASLELRHADQRIGWTQCDQLFNSRCLAGAVMVAEGELGKIELLVRPNGKGLRVFGSVMAFAV